MSRWIAVWAALLLVPVLSGQPVPPELDEALARLSTNAPRGWGFTQTSEGEGRSRVERYVPLGPTPARWELLQMDGRAPTDGELESYRKNQVLREGANPAPNVKEQIDRATCEKVGDEGDRSTWRFRLVPGTKDAWAPHMAATFTLHRPSGTIETVELASFEPFSPMFLTNIAEARTTMRYSLPDGDRPSLLQEIIVKVRGSAWFFRSLDSHLTVRYSDYRYYGRKPDTTPAQP